MMKIKRLVYWMGFRPEYGSIFHSPSLTIYYWYYDRENWRKNDRRNNNWGGKF